MDLAPVFAQYQNLLDADQDLREVIELQKILKHMLLWIKFLKEIRLIVRELDTTGREVSLVLQQIHQEDGLNQSKKKAFIKYLGHLNLSTATNIVILKMYSTL